MDREEFHKTAIEVEDEMGVCGLADRDFYEKFAWRISQRYNARLLAVARAAKRIVDSDRWRGLIHIDDLEAALAAVEDLL